LIGGETTAELADLVSRPHLSQQRLGLCGRESLGCAAGDQPDQVTMQAVDTLGSQVDELLAPVGQQPERGAAVILSPER
jgi:hypothetical protein